MAEPTTAATALAASNAGAQSFLNPLSQLATSAFNVHEARQNRRFMRNMANAEMQRRVADLRAAGLNPLLAVAGKGVGSASTPSTSAAHVDAPQIGSSAESIGLLLQARLNEAQVTDLTSAANLKDTQAGDISFMQKERLINLQAQTQAALSQKGLTDAQKAQLQIQANLIAAQIKKLGIDTSTSALQLEKEKLKKLPYEIINKQIEKVRKKGIMERMGVRNPMGTLRDQFRNFQERKRKKVKQRGATGKY